MTKATHDHTPPAPAGKRVGMYLRVSTNGQSTENQRRELEQVALLRGWTVVEVYEDAGVSGARGRDRRPAFDRLLKDAARRKLDVVAAWSVDRLGRSLRDLVAFMDDLHALGVDLYLHRQAMDTTTSGGKALFQMLGVFSEFERSLIQERVLSGLARARAKGKRLGRPPSVKPGTAALIRADRKSGASLRALARRYRTSTGTVRRVLADA